MSAGEQAAWANETLRSARLAALGLACLHGAGALAACSTAPDVEDGPLRVDLRTSAELVTAEIRNVSDAPLALLDFPDSVDGAPEQLRIRVQMTNVIFLNQTGDLEGWWSPAYLRSTLGDASAMTLAPGETLTLQANAHDLMLGMRTERSLTDDMRYQVRLDLFEAPSRRPLVTAFSRWTALD